MNGRRNESLVYCQAPPGGSLCSSTFKLIMNGRRDGRARGRRGNLRNVFLVSYFLSSIVPGKKGKNAPLFTTHLRKHELICPGRQAGRHSCRRRSMCAPLPSMPSCARRRRTPTTSDPANTVHLHSLARARVLSGFLALCLSCPLGRHPNGVETNVLAFADDATLLIASTQHIDTPSKAVCL